MIILTGLQILKRAIPLIEQLMDDEHPRESITKEDLLDAKADQEAAMNRIDDIVEGENGDTD